MGVINFIITVIVFIISAIPLHFAVKFLKGKTSFFKTLFIAFISGIIVTAIKQYFSFFGWIIAFFISVWIYHESFRLKWWKAFSVGLVQFFISIIFLLIIGFLAAIIGISIALL